MAFLGKELFSQYRIITSERNPFDRQVSLFTQRTGRTDVDRESFSRKMCSPSYNLLHYNRLHNWSIYTIGGQVVAHHVIRFESLHDDLAAVLRALGARSSRFQLPHLKQSRGTDAPAYRTLYDEAARKRVASWYRREIEYFRYEF